MLDSNVCCFLLINRVCTSDIPVSWPKEAYVVKTACLGGSSLVRVRTEHTSTDLNKELFYTLECLLRKI